MKGKILIALTFMALALAAPMRTGHATGQSAYVDASCYRCHGAPIVKVEKKKKRFLSALTEKEKEIAAFVKVINPVANATTLAKAIVRYAPKAHLEPEMFAALIAHESGFRASEKVCYNRRDRKTNEVVYMCDHGLPQVNDFFWAGKFDFERIRTDESYAIQAGAIVLSGLYKTYGEGQPENWWSTYNSAVDKHRRVYESLVLARFEGFKSVKI